MELLFDCKTGPSLSDDVTATSPVVSVWPRFPRRKSLLSLPLSGDPATWAGVFEDDKASDELLDESPSTICFRRKISMLVRVVVVSSQVLTRGKSGLMRYTADLTLPLNLLLGLINLTLTSSSTCSYPQPPEFPQSSQ